MEEKFFEEMFRGELEIDHQEHPPFSVLLGYVLGELEGREERGVAVHITTCARCSADVAELRARAQALDGRLEALPNPLERYPLKGPKRRLFTQIRGMLVEPPAPRRLLAHVSAYAVAAVLLVVVNLVLDRMLVPQPSPFGSPVEPNRWWVNLYWLLLPWGLLLGWQAVRLRRRSSEKPRKRGGSR